MVKKYMYELTGPYATHSSGETEPLRKSLVAANDSLHTTLNLCKNQISRHHHSRRWDQCKKFTNEYELVFTSSAEFPGVVSHTPISRSFFKLWEMLLDVPELASRKGQMTAAFLAEGPGGFIEAFIRYRALFHRATSDQLHGMTLLSRHKNVPGWKAQPPHAYGGGVVSASNLHVHKGADGTGDMYRLANIDRLCADVGEGSCDLVTADGGFDFSGDFNNQEDASLRLLLCETYSAMRLQRPGGAFVLKVYDVHSMATIRMLFALRECYACVRITKPLTSRPANSEKYVLCTGFIRCTPHLLAAFRAACCAGGEPTQADAALRESIPRVPTSFMMDLVHLNSVYIARQMCYIGRTIQMINEHVTLTDSPTGSMCMDTVATSPAMRSTLRHQLSKSIRWCHKYSIPSSVDALRHYRRIS